VLPSYTFYVDREKNGRKLKGRYGSRKRDEKRDNKWIQINIERQICNDGLMNGYICIDRFSDRQIDKYIDKIDRQTERQIDR
jgi:hypothetical protein